MGILTVGGIALILIQVPSPDMSTRERTNALLVLFGTMIFMTVADIAHIFAFFVVYRDFDYIHAVLLNPLSSLPKV